MNLRLSNFEHITTVNIIKQRKLLSLSRDHIREKSPLLVQPRKCAYLWQDSSHLGFDAPAHSKLSPHSHFSTDAISPLPPTTANNHPKKTMANPRQIQLLVNLQEGQEIQPEPASGALGLPKGAKDDMWLSNACVYGGSAVQEMEQ